MKSFFRWLGIIIGILLTGVVGGVAYLAWRASKRTGKGVVSSLPDVPEEAQLVASETKSRVTQAIDAGLKAAQEKATAVKNLIPGMGSVESVEEAEGQNENTQE